VTHICIYPGLRSLSPWTMSPSLQAPCIYRSLHLISVLNDLLSLSAMTSFCLLSFPCPPLSISPDLLPSISPSSCLCFLASCLYLSGLSSLSFLDSWSPISLLGNGHPVSISPGLLSLSPLPLSLSLWSPVSIFLASSFYLSWPPVSISLAPCLYF
jgi:hypothetical protein